jgi:hypothetical protein
MKNQDQVHIVGAVEAIYTGVPAMTAQNNSFTMEDENPKIEVKITDDGKFHQKPLHTNTSMDLVHDAKGRVIGRTHTTKKFYPLK